jgi:pyruvate/2-oxoglutarate dehydrogenase complex dihydrolipoamide acyltransferase (E2) component
MQTLNIPYGALSRVVRADKLLALRDSLVEPFEKRHGVKPALTHFFFKAAALALEEAPALNAALDGDRLVFHGARHIGMVVTPPGGDGIVIPVLRDVQAKPLARIAREWSSMMKKVKEGRLELDDLTGGTFTISNVGPLGIDLFTPLIHPPESAILGVSRIREEPVAEEGRVVVGRTMTLIVGADHRVFDAEPIGVFLETLDQLFQNPAELLI